MDLTTLFKLSYGLYIVNSAHEQKRSGQVVNVVFQISAEPPTIATSINRNNFTHELISQSKRFSVMILEKDTPLSHIGRFGFKSGRELDKFDGLELISGKLNVPIIKDYCVGYLEVEVEKSIEVETHTVFIGKLVSAEQLNKKEPMTYAYYHEVKRGTTPPSAATYQKSGEDKVSSIPPKEGKIMSKYRCVICNYEYDPEVGDPDSGIAPGTPFEEIPADWVCPICGAGKDQFEKIA